MNPCALGPHARMGNMHTMYTCVPCAHASHAPMRPCAGTPGHTAGNYLLVGAHFGSGGAAETHNGTRRLLSNAAGRALIEKPITCKDLCLNSVLTKKPITCKDLCLNSVSIKVE